MPTAELRARTSLVAALCLSAGSVLAVEIPAGYDYFITEPTLSGVLIPGVGFIHLEGFATPPAPGLPDPLALFPLPPGVVPPTGVVGFRTTWLDPHGTVVGPESRHKVTPVTEPIMGIFPFDTVVRRTNTVNITGVGATADVHVEIAWLSLRSTAPIDIGFGPVDVYVGLTPGTQTLGLTRLISTSVSGEFGQVDLGQAGTTTIDTGSPDFLGLPVNYDIHFIPHGLDPIVGNIAHTEHGQAIFQGGGTHIPSGRYSPTPGAAALLGLAGIISSRRRR